MFLGSKAPYGYQKDPADKHHLIVDESAADILYTVDAVTGDLYTIDKATAAASFVGATGYTPLYQQSMAVDHDTNKLYWAAYQDFSGTAAFLELDKATGEILSSDPVEYNSQLSGLLKPYDCGRDLIPDGAAAIAGQTLQLQATVLPVSVSSVDKTVTWTSSDETVATVDENGLVTALSGGTVTITASAGSYSDSCTVTVLAEAQKFYAYDETATRWVQIDTATGALTTVHDETGLAPIMSAADVNGVIYTFDDDGYFYAIDPDTFQRVKLSDGIHGRQQDCFDGYSYYPVDVDITSLSYDAESGHLFGLMNGVYEDYDVGLYLVYSAIVEINLQEGRMDPYTWEEMQVGDLVIVQTYDGSDGIYRPGNLLVKGGYAYSVDTWYSGILSRVSMTWVWMISATPEAM